MKENIPVIDCLMQSLDYKKEIDFWYDEPKIDPLNKNIKKLNLYLKRKTIKK